MNRNKLCFTRHRLKNGVILLVSENQSLPLVSMSAFVLAGSDQNTMDQPGTAAMTARLLDEGTRSYKVHEIAQIVESSGGSLTTFSERELSGVSLLSRSRDFPTMVDLLAEMLMEPVFPEDRFQLEREKVLGRLEAMEDDSQIIAANRFNYRIYQGTPLQYPISGTRKSIKGLCVGDLQRFHCLRYAPQNAILVIVGAMETQRTIEDVEERFSTWRNPDFERIEISGFQKQLEPHLEEHFMDKEQLIIYMGHLGVRRNNPDYYALQVMDVVLGGGPGFTSRIPRKLRDEQGLAYSTYSDISGSAGMYPGMFVAFVGTSPQNRETALRSLCQEIKNLIENGISVEELQTAQEFLTGSFVFDFQSNVNVARLLLTTELFQLGDDYPEQYPHLIQMVDREGVGRVAGKYLDALNCTTVVVGPTDGRRKDNQ